MSLSDKELKEIAYLARINIDENSFPSLKGELDEIFSSIFILENSFPSLKGELDEILGLFEKLNSANTDGVEAMSHPLNLSQPTRKDEVTEINQ